MKKESLYDEVLGRLKQTTLKRWTRIDAGRTAQRVIDAHAINHRQLMMRALRYSFDAEATAVANRFGLEYMEALQAGMKWLRPLADVVWIEYDNHAALDAVGAVRHADAPERCGYLITSIGDDMMTVHWLSVSKTKVWLPATGAMIDPLGRLSRKVRPNVNIGDDGVIEQITQDMARELQFLLGCTKTDDVACQMTKYLGLISPSEINESKDQRILAAREAEHKETAGLARRAASFLFMLHHRRLVRGRSGEKLLLGPPTDEYFKERTITIVLPREKALKSLERFANRTNRLGPRRHEVEGHWCWSHKTNTKCNHDWQAENNNRRYRCPKCGGARWYKDKHLRGDATRGFDLQQRKVTFEVS